MFYAETETSNSPWRLRVGSEVDALAEAHRRFGRRLLVVYKEDSDGGFKVLFDKDADEHKKFSGSN